ncbi:MAG: S8 family serine peptidase [Prosthecobacter sp.]
MKKLLLSAFAAVIIGSVLLLNHESAQPEASKSGSVIRSALKTTPNKASESEAPATQASTSGSTSSGSPQAVTKPVPPITQVLGNTAAPVVAAKPMRIEDFDPVKALASGNWYHPDLPEDQVRAKMVEYLSNKAMAEKRRAENWAKAVGMPIREEQPGGGVSEIMRLEPDGSPVYYSTHNVQAAQSVQTDLVRDTSPYSVNGSNGTGRFNIGEWDGGSARSTHGSLKGRVIQKEGTITLSDHATHVAGTMIGGSLYPGLLGMAPFAGILSYDFPNDVAEMTAEAQITAALGAKVLVSNHSYGLNAGWFGNQYWGNWLELEDRKFGRYDSQSVLIDSLCFNSPYYQPFFSAGNDRDDATPATGATFQRLFSTAAGVLFQNNPQGYNPAIHPGSDFQSSGYDTIPGYSGSKNVITVGAVTDARDAAGNRSLGSSSIAVFSNWGPTDDGRIKPDIVAVGVDVLSAASSGDDRQSLKDGTSMASPGACGSALLLQELYSDKFSGVAMRASTLKALILHTADDLGSAGPDYIFGWGMMNTKKAADQILAHKNAPVNNHMIEDALTTTQPSKSYSFAWNQIGPIRVTICWTDPAGTAQGGLDNSTANLVNDLDVRVTGPGGTTLPYVLNPASPGTAATTGDNVRDNVEQVYIAAPTMGTYTVTVNHKGTLTGVNGRQNFSLIHEGLRSEAPVIRLSTKLLAFSTSPSSSPDSYSFTVQNTGVRTLNYSITDNASWLHVNPVSGSATNGETDTLFLGFTTSSLASGVYTGRVYVTAPDAATAELEVRLTVTGNTVPLAQALDTAETVSSSGSAPWYGQTALTHDSADAARSAPVKDNQDTAFSMSVQGPGELKFWWKVNSETSDKLSFEIGTAVNQQISGSQDWAQVTVPIATGTQKLTWRYKKDSISATGSDAGWVDEVRYVRHTANLELTQNRVDLITTLGQNPPALSFDVLNEGTGTVNYTVSSSKTWVLVTPSSGSTSGEPDTIGVGINATALKAGLNTARVTVQPVNGVAKYFDINLNVLPATSIPLNTAVDHGTATSWVTESSPTLPKWGWFGQAVGAFDKIDCVRSGTELPDAGVSGLVLRNLPGPCTVSFYWRVDCEPGGDKLSFFDNATEVTQITGLDQPWKQVTYFVGPGMHDLYWRYIKDLSQAQGLDCGFVDKVVLDFKAPKLQVSTASLVGSGIAGGTPSGPSFQISNTGAGTLNYAITADQIWCKPSVAKGTAMTETDSINLSFDARSLSAGTHYANLMVNGGTAGSHSISVELSLGGNSTTPVQVLTNNLQSFAKPALPSAVDGWGFYSSDEGRIAIVSGALRMDDKIAGSLFSLNEAILHANLTGKVGMYLTFKYRHSNDEPHILPDTFTGHANGDGVSISADGITWHTVDQLLNADGNFTTRVLNLDAAVAAAGITYNADFQIKFQQYDDCSWLTDGAEFDDVMLSTLTVADDHANSFNGATVVSPSSTTNGKIEVAGDQDMFCITVSQQTAMTLFTTGVTDTFGELFDGGGNLISSFNDGIGKNFFISRTMDPGTYYVSVRGFNNAKGLYALVTTSRLVSAPPSLTLPPDDWTPLTYSPFIPVGPNISYAMNANGLLKQGQGETLLVLGSLKVKVGASRTFSGNVFWEGVSWPVVGAFPSGSGAYSGTVLRKGLSSLNYTLEYMNEGMVHSEWRLLGTVTDGITTANAVLLEDYNWNAQAYVGSYTIAMPADNNGSTLEPQGMAYGVLVVTATGDAVLQMTLPDGNILSVATPLTNKEHGGVPEISFYVPFGTGFYAGELRFRDLAGISDLDGRVSWRKVADAKSKFYPSGFQINRRILGSKFVPIANSPDLQLKPSVSSAIAKFFGSDLPYIPGGLRLVGWSIQDKLSSQFNGETWTYALTTKGVVSGNFKHAATATTGNFGGVILQKQNRVGGLLKGNFQTGLFFMEP